MIQKKGLQKLHFEIGYTTFDNDVHIEFFNPCLQNSTKYNVFSGYFSSGIFISLLEGLKDFVRNKGIINLVLGRLPPKDFDIINATNEELQEKFLEELMSEIEEVAYKSTQEHGKLLAWLLYHGHLNIKYAVVDFGYDNAESDGNYSGFLHSKLGLFYDKYGNSVSFIGSLNFTYQALELNYEEFDVFMNWNEGKKENFLRHDKNFQDFWSDNKDYFRIVELPNSDLRKRITPIREINDSIFDNIDEFNQQLRKEILSKIQKRKKKQIIDSKDKILPSEIEEIPIKSIEQVKWRKPQLEGYQSWLDNNKLGILEIATGVGKTLIAIKAIYDFITQDKSSNRKIIAIVVPDNLIDQWEDDLSEWLVNDKGKLIPRIYSIYADNIHKKSITEILQDFQDGFVMTEKPLIAIAYYNTFSKKVIPILDKFENKDILFIADEVHELGTKKRIKRFSTFNPNYKLGLSATPNRYFDDEGTAFLKNYFSGIIYNYEIADGISDGYLSPYKYYPIFCSLSAKERTDYNKFSRNITALRNMYENEKNTAKRRKLKSNLDLVLINRKRIIKKAESKYQEVYDIIDDLKSKDELKYILIYTEDDTQLDQIYNSLIDKDYSVSKITQHEAMIERRKTIEHVKIGIQQILLAEKILDQGIDIPNLKYGILVSSTGNIRQHIQRRGRLLRISKVKEFSVVFDLVINEIESEIKRVSTFCNDCMNQEEVIEICLKEGIILEKINGEILAIDRE